MTTLQLIMERLKDLPSGKLQEVLDFVEFVRTRAQQAKPPLRDLEGLWKGLDVSSEDIEDARREMWGGFPRHSP